MNKLYRILEVFFVLSLFSCQPTDEEILAETQTDIEAEENQEEAEEAEGVEEVAEEVEEAGEAEVVEETSPAPAVKNHRGDFDGSVVDEISGLAFSRKFKGRIYVHNDSGDAAQFFVANSSGGNLKKVKLTDSRHTDYEDMAIGPCGLNSCLYIGDIGDNSESRSEIRVLMVEEKETFSSSVRPTKTLRLVYGDGDAHNAESLAVHPKTGDLFILTKTSGASQLFKLSGTQISAAKDGSKLSLKELGKIAFRELFKNADNEATSMDISPDGTQFVVLTYAEAFEFKFDLSNKEKISTNDFKLVKKTRYQIKVLPQQEAIAYDLFDHQIYYTTETGSDDPAPLLRVF